MCLKLLKYKYSCTWSHACLSILNDRSHLPHQVSIILYYGFLFQLKLIGFACSFPCIAKGISAVYKVWLHQYIRIQKYKMWWCVLFLEMLFCYLRLGISLEMYIEMTLIVLILWTIHYSFTYNHELVWFNTHQLWKYSLPTKAITLSSG